MRQLKFVVVVCSSLLLARAAAVAQTSTKTSIVKRVAVTREIDSLKEGVSQFPACNACAAVKSFIDKPFVGEVPPYAALVETRDALRNAPRDTVQQRRARRITDRSSVLPEGDGQPAALFGGLPAEAEIVAGLADFLAKRAKDELVLAYLSDVQAQLDRQPVVPLLLPTSTAIIRSISDVNVGATIPTLRSAAITDFRSFPDRLGVIADSLFGPAAAVFLNASNDTAAKAVVLNLLSAPRRPVWLRIVLQAVPLNATDTGKFDEIATQVAKLRTRLVDARTHLQPVLQGIGVLAGPVRRIHGGTDPTVAFAVLADLTPDDISQREVRVALATLGIAAREFTDAQGHLEDVVQDARRRQLFAAFLAGDLAAAEGPSAHAAVLQHLQQLYDANAEPVFAFIADVQTARDQFAALRGAITDAKDEAAAQRARIEGIELVFSLLDGVSRLLPQDLLTTANWTVVRQRLDGQLAFLPVLKDFATAIEASDYTQIVSSAVVLLQTEPTYFPPTVVRFAAFASTIAAAKDANGVSAALDAAAEPVGSYRVKRTPLESGARRVSITLNAYVGGAGGVEGVMDGDVGKNWAGQAAVAAPVGFEAAWSTSHGSFSLFFPIIDVGSLTAARFKGNDTIEDHPTTGFRQVLSPGAFAVFGLSRTKPFSLGFGAQVAPSLREVAASGKSVSVVRLSALFAIDIPVFRF